MAFMPPKFVYLLIFFAVQIQLNQSQLDTINLTKSLIREKIKSLSYVANREKIDLLEKIVKTKLLKNEQVFYNYSVMCGDDLDSRVRKNDHDANWQIDKSIPVRYTQFAKDTFIANKNRENKCPQWSPLLDTMPPTGSMDSLSIAEDTPVGSVVYILSATDEKRDPLYYFIRNAENEDISIFNVTTYQSNREYIGKVTLNQKLDADNGLDVYRFIVYAYDGQNLIERFSTVKVRDVDDEAPVIRKTNNKYYNEKKKRFEFEVEENVSIGTKLNTLDKFIFEDIDTNPRLLVVSLVDAVSGLHTIPFVINSGELIVISNIDYEARDEYDLRLFVKDSSSMYRTDSFDEVTVNIKIKDLADQKPRFEIPSYQNQEFTLIENTVGQITELRAVSQNLNPLDSMTFNIEAINPSYMIDKFSINYSPVQRKFFLNCTNPIELQTNGNDEMVELKLQAIEYSETNGKINHNLTTEANINIRVVGGDVCRPTFDQTIYNFTVFENEIKFFDGIWVTDCDHGINGKIFLSTSDSNFDFKVANVYRNGKLGLVMKNDYDYEKVKMLQFTIFATGSDSSLNKYSSSALVNILVLSRNEHDPVFVLPKRHDAFDSKSYFGSDKMFYFRPNENKDFNLRIKAEDLDDGLDGEISYRIEMINSEDTFEVKRTLNEMTKEFHISIDGMYLDAASKAPITFIVNAVNENSDDMKRSNEIIINIVPKYSFTRPVYFDKQEYNFQLREDKTSQVYRLKLINDNLKRSEVEVFKVRDDLDLFKYELYSYNSLTNDNFENEMARFEDLNNEELLYLQLSDPTRIDLDDIYRKNNYSDIYKVTLTAQIRDKANSSTSTHVSFKLVDINENAPVMKMNDLEISDNEFIEALVPSTFVANTPLFFSSNVTFSDSDFSEEFGLPSVHFKLNDTRFIVDNQAIVNHLRSKQKDAIPFVVRKLTDNSEENDFISVEIMIEDNYFDRRLNIGRHNNQTYVMQVKKIGGGPRSDDSKERIWKEIKSLIIQVNLLTMNMTDLMVCNDESTTSALKAIINEVTSANEADLEEIPESVLDIFQGIQNNQTNCTNVDSIIADYGARALLAFDSDPYEFSVNETFTGEIGQINANYMQNISSNQYELVDCPQNFEINTTTGIVYLIEELDYEVVTKIECQAKAIFNTTTKPIEKLVSLTMNVIDLNDNDPYFYPENYQFSIILNDVTEAGSEIGVIYAKDFDESDYNNLTTQFNHDQPEFEIEKLETCKDEHYSMFRIVNRKALEPGTVYPPFGFEVDVIDKAGNRNSTGINIDVVVPSKIASGKPLPEINWINVNDHSQDDKTCHQTQISDKTEENTVVFNFKAMFKFDIDSEIKYKSLTNNPMFQVNETTGEVTTKKGLNSRSKRSVVFVQAYYNVEDDKGLKEIRSAISSVEISVIHHDSVPPVFTKPANFKTEILIDRNTNGIIYKLECEESASFQFGKSEIIQNEEFSILNDRIIYKADEELNNKLSLIFPVDSQTGEISFNSKSLLQSDLMLIFKNRNKHLLVRLTVSAKDASTKSTQSFLYIRFDLDYLLELYNADLELRFDANHPYSKVLNSDTFVRLTGNRIDFVSEVLKEYQEFPNEIRDEYFSLKQNTKIGSNVISVVPYLDETQVLTLPYTLTVPSVSSDENMDPSVYFTYNNDLRQIELIRKLDLGFANKSFRFQLLDNRQLTKVNTLHTRYNLNIFITDDEFNTKPRLSKEALENLNVIYVFDFVTKISTIDDLISTNESGLVLATYEFENTVNCTAVFDVSATELDVTDNFELTKNSTHLDFKRKNNTWELRDLKDFYNFKIILSNEFGSVAYMGRLYCYAINDFSNFVMSNSNEFKGELQRSKVENTTIGLNPSILLNNILPLGLNLRLVDLEMQVVKYFDMRPSQIDGIDSNIMLPIQDKIVLYLAKSLEGNPATKLWTNIEFGFELYTQSAYLNKILTVLTRDYRIHLEMKFENQYAPRITQVKIMDTVTDDYSFDLIERTYTNQKIAEITAVDEDKGIQGQIEYVCFGPNILSIDQKTGVITIDGILDAENEQSIKFSCFARDMANPSKQSSAIEFFINVVDEDEFIPMIQTDMQFHTIQEIVDAATLPKVLGSITCFDNDKSSELKLNMQSVSYIINGHKTPTENVSYQSYLETMFDIVKVETDESLKFTRNLQKVDLRLIGAIDYERLFKPYESLIQIDFVCSDGNFEKNSHVLLRVEDLNDNVPIFTDNFSSIIDVRESNDLNSPLARLEATDMDLSKEYGPDSLIYSISDCKPDYYRFYVRFGNIYSNVILDADTDEMIEARIESFKSSGPVRKLNETVDVQCKVKVSDSLGGSSSLSSERDVTIRFKNENDNEPVIKIGDIKENTIEIAEGLKTQGKVLAQIEVFDRDGVSNLECKFGNGLTIYEYFEFKTEIDINDPFTAWCILKVQDSMYVSYDAKRISDYLFDLNVIDHNPVGFNSGLSKIQLKIHVISVNNRAPMFLNNDEEIFYALDTSANGTVIGTVLATDIENPNPKKLIYVLNSKNGSELGISNKFELINREKGDFHWGAVEIVTKSKLSVKESPYILIVTAYDGPINMGTTRSSQKTIKVHVINKGSVSVWIDKNTGESVDYYMTSIKEESPKDTHVITVKATLSAATLNQQDVKATYEIESHLSLNNSPIKNPYYRIDPATGEIFTTEINIDNEEIDSFKKQLMRHLKVKASSPDGLHKYTTHVSLDIVDVNDNSPEFDVFMNRDFLFCVTENETSVDSVGLVFADDLDSGVNGEVEYKLDTSALNYDTVSRHFEIDSTTGKIFLKSPIDREQNSSVIISLIASDKGTESRSTSLDIKVCVQDINDNSPVFDTRMPTTIHIDENSLFLNLTLDATDLDEGPNGTLLYYIDDDKSNKFIIDSSINKLKKDKLSITVPFDYEDTQTYNLTVIASDNGVPALLSKINLKINVVDQNDNAPEFIDIPIKPIEIKLTNSTGEIIFINQFKTIDKDLSPEYRNVEYKIISVYSRQVKLNGEPIDEDDRHLTRFEENLFEIDSKSGNLTAVSQLLYEIGDNYFVIELQAYDSENKTLSDNVKITVLFKLPIKTPPRVKSHELTISKKVLASDDAPENPYIVHIIQATDPTDHGLYYYLDAVEESQLRNARDISEKSSDEPLKPNHDNLFRVDKNNGVVTAVKSRNMYVAQYYRLKLRAALKIDETISDSGYLTVNIDSKAESLFDESVFTASVDENVGEEIVFDLREKLKNKNSNVMFEINHEKSMPSGILNKCFSLEDKKSGKVKTLNKEIDDSESIIDYEKFNEVLLAINILDEKTFDQIEMVILKIQINDLNDNKPVFDKKYNYEVAIKEDDQRSRTNSERLLTKFSVFDNDGTEANSQLDCSIVSVKPSSFKTTDFEIKRIEKITNNTEFGLYKRAGVNLDRENFDSESVIYFEIEAIDNGKNSLSQKQIIKLELLDINDNRPKILNSDLYKNDINVKESQSVVEPITTIKAIDLDKGKNAQLKFEIISEKTQLAKKSIKEDTEHVKINKQGELFLIRELDYETERKVELIVRISDISPQPLDVKQNITINIENVNDNRPVFTSYPQLDDDFCRLKIEEGKSSKNKVFYKFEAHDDDEDSQNSLSFEIIEITTIDKKTPGFDREILDNSIFNLDRNSGELSLSDGYELDREENDNYKLRIRLRDQEENGFLESFKDCHVQVTDVNDNWPQFMPEQLKINGTNLKEFPLKNEKNVINWFGATDADLGVNASIEYDLIANDELTKKVEHVFGIDDKGYFLIDGHSLQNQDVFNLNDVYRFSISARDRGVPVPLMSRLDFSITIDEDYFKISKTSIDQLELTTSDGNTLVNLEENSPVGTEVTQIVVKNSLLKHNKSHAIEFRLLNFNETFNIQLNGKIMVINSTRIDYEKIKQFLVRVEAIERYILNGENRVRSGRKLIIVKLENVNDNPPRFNKMLYELNTNENIFEKPFYIENGDHLIHITDQDLMITNEETSSPKLAKLRVDLEGQDSFPFSLEHVKNISAPYSNFYRLKTHFTFDAEQKDSYEFKVVAYDGISGNTAKASIIINVNDINDNSPRFKNTLTELTINENLPVGSSVLKLESSDVDRTLKMSETNYKIVKIVSNDNVNVDSRLGEAFELDKVTGDLKVASSHLLNREIFEYFALTLKAYNTENEEQSDEFILTIKLNDLNDETPKFDRNLYIVSVLEKIPVPHVVIELNAQDSDLGSNGQVTYEIDEMRKPDPINLELENVFEIEGNKLILNKHLNVDTNHLEKQFELIIKAKDGGGKHSETTVVIDVIDVNDQEPKLDMSAYEQWPTFTIQENNQINDTLFSLKCIDPDYSKTDIKYELVNDLNGDWEKFSIDMKTGAVTANSVFDYENRQEFALRFKCIDGSVNTTQMSSLHDARIHIIDLDDNEPVFSERLVKKNVSENLQIGSIIDLHPTIAFIPIANDIDTLEENTKVSYHIIAGNEEETFSLDSNTGELKIVKELERTLDDFYHLKIRATSRKNIENIKKEEASPSSILNINLTIVSDELSIQFSENNYYVSTPKFLEDIDEENLRQYQFTELRNIGNPSIDIPTSKQEYLNRLETSSIFFSRAHLIKRKNNRHIRFSIEMVQSIRKDSSNIQLLPKDMDIVNSMDTDIFAAQNLSRNALNLKLNPDRDNLFDIDPYTGKIYINRQYLSDFEYNFGDMFVLTIVATAYKPYESEPNTSFENTLTHLFVSVTERDYSLVMPVTNNLKSILNENLNPLKEMYIPRLLKADGVQLTIQDLVVLNKTNTEPARDSLFNVIIQVETCDHGNQPVRPVSFDRFIGVWQNFSTTDVFFDRFERVNERQFNKRHQADQDLAFLKVSSETPFYFNWLFWFLLIALLLSFIIAMFCLNSYCLKKMIKKANKQSGLIIEYPQGYSPIYDDGVLNLNNKMKDENLPNVIINDFDYEEQELIMNIEDETLNVTKND